MPEFHSKDLESLFAVSLGSQWNTLLRGGAEEPFFLPAERGSPAVIRYTRDYFRSALHEVAHWCIAGQARRQLPDFGYWYAPDGRDGETQQAFLKVEEAPQALEWIFCAACGHSFCVSLDNLSGDRGDVRPFEEAVFARAAAWLAEEGMPPRARVWTRALARHFGNRETPDRQALERVFRAL